jgi:hypothetical protein
MALYYSSTANRGIIATLIKNPSSNNLDQYTFTTNKFTCCGLFNLSMYAVNDSGINWSAQIVNFSVYKKTTGDYNYVKNFDNNFVYSHNVGFNLQVFNDGWTLSISASAFPSIGTIYATLTQILDTTTITTNNWNQSPEV